MGKVSNRFGLQLLLQCRLGRLSSLSRLLTRSGASLLGNRVACQVSSCVTSSSLTSFESHELRPQGSFLPLTLVNV